MNKTSCESLLKKGFIFCCLITAATGVITGISCEARRISDCTKSWDDGGQRALAAAGALSAALANFRGSDGIPPSPSP